MSSHNSGRRHRSSRRSSGDSRRQSPSRLPENIFPVSGPEASYGMKNEPPLPPPPPPQRGHINDESFDHYSRRGRQYFPDPSPRMHRFEGRGPEDDTIGGHISDDESMPEIQQTSRPEPRPVSGYHATSIPHSGIHPSSMSKPQVPTRNEKKQVAWGDIQLSAVREASEDWMTLNSIMICVYRSSRRRFDSRRIWLVRKPDRRVNVASLPKYALPEVLRSDEDFFNEIIQTYKRELRGNVRRFISFKTVSTARILEYGNNRFGTAELNPKLFSPVFMAIFNDPEASLKKKKPIAWVNWFRKVRLKSVREQQVDLAIELLEDYEPMRVMGSIAFSLSTLLMLTAVWLIRGGDPAYVSSVMSFVLGFFGAIIALTALWEFLDLGHMGGGKDYLVLDRKEFRDAMRNKNDWGRPGEQFIAPK